MPTGTCSFCGTFISDPSAQRCPNCQTLINAAAPSATRPRTLPVFAVVAGALVGTGTALVRAGRVAEGLRLVDEAMIDAVSGLLGGVMTARIYCGRRRVGAIVLERALRLVRTDYWW